MFDAVEAQYKGKGAFIIQGCTVTGNDISSGIVFIDGKIMPFAGATSVTFPVYMRKAADVLAEVRSLEQGGSAATQLHILAEITSSLPGSGEYIIMSASGGRTYFDAISNEVVRTKGNQTIGGVKTFRENVTAPKFIGEASQIKDNIVSTTKLQDNAVNRAKIQNPDWTEVTVLANGWDFLEGFVPGYMRYKIDSTGIVHVQAHNLDAVGSSSETLFTLPALYRPTEIVIAYAEGKVGQDYYATTVRVGENGAVYVRRQLSQAPNIESVSFNIVFQL
jgi:hypothetical protein